MLQGQLTFEPNHNSQYLNSKTPPKKEDLKKDPEQTKKGKEEAAKDIIKEDEKSKLKLDELLDRSTKVLASITTVWPFVLFPKKIIVDAAKVSVRSMEFFYSEHTHSIMIKDISHAVVETSLFFATLKIIDKGYTEPTVTIPFLPKDQAVHFQSILQGLIITAKEGVDLSVIDDQNLAEKVEEIGKPQEPVII